MTHHNVFARLIEDNVDSDDDEGGVDPVEKLLRVVRQATGSKTLDYFYQGGCCGLKISWEETQAGLVPKLIQAFLDRGHAICTNDDHRVCFPAYSYYSEALKEFRLMMGLLTTVKYQGRCVAQERHSLNPDDWTLSYCKNMLKQVNTLPNDDTKKDLIPPLFQKETKLRGRRRYRCHDVPWSSADEVEYRAVQRQIRDVFDVPVPTEDDCPPPPLKRARVSATEEEQEAEPGGSQKVLD